MRTHSVFFALLACCVLHSSPTANADEYDWLNWRGPQGNGHSRELGLVDEFDPDNKVNLLWQRTDVGTRSTPIVMNGKLYTLARANAGTVQDCERVVCLDAASGKTLWENKFNVYLSDVPAERVGWSCVVGDPETNSVYALGVCGYFQCLDADTGKTKWSHSMHEEYGLLSTYGGRTNVPIIVDDQVIISAVVIGWGEMAVPAHRFISFDKRTGQVVWFNGTHLSPYDTTYSTPALTVLNGQDAMVFGSGDGAVWAFQPRTGVPIWEFAFSRRGLNVSPLVVNDVVYTGHSEENTDGRTMGSLVAIDGDSKGNITTQGLIWQLKEVMVGKSSPFIVNNRLYAIDDKAGLWIFDPKTGKQLFSKRARANMKLGTVMRSTPLIADGKIYACTANGRWWILRPSNKAPGVEVVQRQLRLEGESYGSPIVSRGRIYLPTTTCLYCIGKQGQTPKLGPAPKQPQAKQGDKEPAHVQVVPAEALLAPGESQQFKVLLYNGEGQLLGESEADFAVDKHGQITSDGKFTAAADASHHAAYVTAKVGDLTGRARVRIVGGLPWKFDFSDGRVPITWVGMRNRHLVLDSELLQALNKQDKIAHQLYLYCMKGFIDSGKGRLLYDDKLPRVPWTSFIRYMDLDGTFSSLDELKKKLDPSLQRLVEEKVLAGFTWAPEGASPMSLAVERGPRKIDENAVMVKLERIPVPGGFTKLGTRSQGWMGFDNMSDYTIQADMMGTETDGKMPDMGLTAQRV